MSKQHQKPVNPHLEAEKVEAERKQLNSRLDDLRAKASIPREQLARQRELMASADREVEFCKSRLNMAESRRESLVDAFKEAPGIIKKCDDEMATIRQRLNTMDHASMIAKAKDLANQIAALRAAGFTVTPPGSEA